MTRIARLAVLGALVVVMAMGVGCAKEPEVTLDPKVAPPAVKKAGVLVAGVDLSTPPFAGTDQRRQAGIDVDVASALAQRLQLQIEFVDVKPSEAATALADGVADVVLSVPLASSDLSQLSLAGSYLSNAPGFFIAAPADVSVEPSLTVAEVRVDTVGVQDKSESFWIVRNQLGTDAARPYPTLREALQALVDEEVELVAGDTIIAGYIARDFPEIRFAGQLAGGSPLAVAVAVENTKLADAVRGELDALSADGVLGTIRRKWVGDIPDVRVEGSTESTSAP